ncbi:hemolysin family protein [Thermopirellula anaerolimosa]
MEAQDLSFWILACGVVCVGVLSAGVRSLRDFPRHKLADLCRRHHRPQRLAEVLRAYRGAADAAELLEWAALAAVVLAAAHRVLLAFESAGGPDGPPHGVQLVPVALSGLGIAAAVLIVGVFIPRAVAAIWAAPVVYHLWPLWRGFARVLRPIVRTAEAVQILLARLTDNVADEDEEEDEFEEEIRSLMTAGERQGYLEEDAKEMIEGVIKLSDVDAAEIMTPRSEMFALPGEWSWDEMLEAVIREGHSRIPVFNQTRDNIVGILYTKDLLPHLARPNAEADRPPWTALLREPLFVPETKPVDALLEDFQRTRNHMAVVLDEYGGVSGVVTLEDILEEIVGEIGDELDPEQVEEIQPLENGRAEALGSARVEEINRRLHLELPEDPDYDTIAGLLMSHLGRIPACGEAVEFGGVRVRVLEATPRRVQRVLIEWTAETDDTDRVGVPPESDSETGR